MKNWIYYLLIFAIICIYFYVGNSVSSYWEAAIKYEKKLSIDFGRNEMSTFSIKDFAPDDFCIFEDSLGNRAYFRVIGMTQDSLLCVNYGVKMDKLPSDIESPSTIVSSGLIIDKRVNWVDKLLGDETNFSDDLVLYNDLELKRLYETHFLIVFELNDNYKQLTANLLMKLRLAYPTVLGLLIFIFFILIFGFNKAIKFIISKYKDVIKVQMVMFFILISSYFNLKYIVFTNSFSWFGWLLLFVFYTLVYFTFQYFKRKTNIFDFEKKEILKFLYLATIGALMLPFSILITSSLDHSQQKEWSANFIYGLQQGLVIWIGFAIANFLNNLIVHISSLRRKSNQLQNMAMIELDAIESKYGFKSKELMDQWKLINYYDSINLIKITQILDTQGWLGSDIVGRQGNTTIFLVIQHSDLAVQEKYLPMMREAVKSKKASGSQLALLEDRVALRQGKKQIYGSQIGMDETTNKNYILPLEDPDNVDQRRAEVGLPPLADYVSRWNIVWDPIQYKKDLPAIEALQKH